MSVVDAGSALCAPVGVWRLREPVPVERGDYGLSARLRAVMEMVPAGASVADVGTDHALLLIGLVGTGRASSGIGLDVAEDALAGARANRARFGVHVVLRRSDGLAELDPGEASVLVLAGMGGRTVREILELRDPRPLGIERIIAQPNTAAEEVRRSLAYLGYPVRKERLVPDGDRFFLTLAADAGTPGEISLEEAFVGLLREDPFYAEWAAHQRRHLEKKPASSEVRARLALL